MACEGLGFVSKASFGLQIPLFASGQRQQNNGISTNMQSFCFLARNKNRNFRFQLDF